jgi:chemotaxis protein methyltransferase CheR
MDVSMHSETDAYDALLRRIERERGMACGSYKDRCLRRRIGVRMRAHGVHTVDAYARVLDTRPDEWDKLLAALTINVTRFFRDASAFAALEAQAYPLLRDRFSERLRVWSAGCSHGHESYSLAMGLSEVVGAARVQVDATDIDVESLAGASAGEYAESALVDVPTERRTRWFTGEALGTARPALRRMVHVARHDLLRDAVPEARYHLIACRNVIIYFSRDAQARLFLQLHHALVPGGVLVLGKVETLVGPARDLFETLNLRERVFQRPLA